MGLHGEFVDKISAINEIVINSHDQNKLHSRLVPQGRCLANYKVNQGTLDLMHLAFHYAEQASSRLRMEGLPPPPKKVAKGKASVGHCNAPANITPHLIHTRTYVQAQDHKLFAHTRRTNPNSSTTK